MSKLIKNIYLCLTGGSRQYFQFDISKFKQLLALPGNW